MKHVFVETNWVVACAAPSHHRISAALDLAERASRREIQIHLPAICLAEAYYPIRTKYQPRQAADAIRKYLNWARSEDQWTPGEIDSLHRTLDRYQSQISNELDNLQNVIEGLRSRPGIEVFALDERMLQRSLDLSSQPLDLKPYDQSILSAVLVRAEQLRAAGESDFSLCELDGDLQPWDKRGNTKSHLATLYNRAHIWVFEDFAMKSPTRPQVWPPVWEPERN